VPHIRWHFWLVAGVVGTFVSKIIKSQKGKREGKGKKRKERETWHLMLRISGGNQNVSISIYLRTQNFFFGQRRDF
jgi:hypothetical protein